MEQKTQASPISDMEAYKKRILIFLEEKNWDKAKDYCEKCLDINPEESSVYLYLLLIDLKLSIIEELAETEIDIGNNKNYINAVKYANDVEKEEIENIYKQNRLNYVRNNIEKNNSIKKYKKLIGMLENIGDYENSNELLDICNNKLKSKNRKSKIIRISVFFVIAFAIVAYISVSLILYSVKYNNQVDNITQYQTLNGQKSELKKSFKSIQAIIDKKQSAIDSAQSEYNVAKQMLTAEEILLSDYQSQSDASGNAYVNDILSITQSGYGSYSASYDAYSRRSTYYNGLVNTAKANVNKAKKDVEKKKTALDNAKKEYDKALKPYKSKIDEHNSKVAELDQKMESIESDILELRKESLSFPYSLIDKIFKKFSSISYGKYKYNWSIDT